MYTMLRKIVLFKQVCQNNILYCGSKHTKTSIRSTSARVSPTIITMGSEITIFICLLLVIRGSIGASVDESKYYLKIPIHLPNKLIHLVLKQIILIYFPIRFPIESKNLPRKLIYLILKPTHLVI